MKRWIVVLFAVFSVFFVVSCTTQSSSFTISFNPNGGSFIPAITTEGNSIIELPDNPTKEGYSFVGWYWDNDIFSDPFTASSLLDRPIFNSLIVYAKWEEEEVPIESFQVTFDSQGGSSVEPLNVHEGNTLSIPNVSREGYSLDGWYISADQGNTLYEKWLFPTSIVTSDITLYAKWVVNEYTITFHCNGGSSIDSIVQDFATTLIEPSIPTRQGYTFSGWYSDFLINTPYEFTTIPAEDLNLYAKWEINPFTITFDSNGGSIVEPITQDYETSVHEPVESIKEGYTFAGWYSDDSLTTPYVFNEMPAQSITLYAKWLMNAYTITLELNGGIGESSIIENYGVPMTSPSPTKEGYSFAGWFTNETFEDEYTFSTMPAQNITLYAKWQINQYTINFDSNEGSLVDSITQDYASGVLEPTEPVKKGYNFAGWYKDTSLEDIYSFTTIPAENVTLYAKWEIITYEVTYLLEGGVNHIVNPDNYTVESPSLFLEEPTRELYTFNGWYDNADFIGDSITEILHDTVGDMTLYAKWEINQYNINYYIYQDYNPLENIILYPEETIKSVSLGFGHSAAITSIGRVFIWGRNNSGQLGDGTTTDKLRPIEITNRFNLGAGETIESISLGGGHSAAVTSIGRAFIWGSSSDGQLGGGTLSIMTTPAELTSFFKLGAGEKITSFSLGFLNSSAITSTGRVFTWGRNDKGQLGDGSIARRIRPVDITRLFDLGPGETIVNMSLGYYHSAAISSEGSIFTWGMNENGQLGDRTTDSKYIPIKITNPNYKYLGDKFKSIYLGLSHTAAITEKGQVYSWGDNSNGQLGNGTTIEKTMPSYIGNLPQTYMDETIQSISLGSLHSAAVTTNGRIFTWGSNANSQLGDGTITQRNNPIEITSRFNLSIGEKIESVSLGGYYSSAITSKGRIFTWGSNAYGQLGNGTITSLSAPTVIKTCVSALVHQDTFDYASETIGYNPVLEGYTFNGWYSDIYLTKPFTFSTMPAKDIALYGKWE